MDVEAFIARWTAREGGAERANYQMFLSELCDVLGVARPDPAGADRDGNDYVFERAVRPRGSDLTTAPKRIDLYRRGAFILEAKQSRLHGKPKALPDQPSFFADEPAELGKAGAARGWDVMMQNARRQAEGYVFLLDTDHVAPPFLLVCDVGHCIEVYADFTGTGRAYDQFPDRKGFRIFLQDLRDATIRERLAAIWTDPLSLDPAKHSARVTREIASRLAAVSKALEASHPPEDVAHFLMRCIFTMFAEDVDLLPRGSFKELLSECVKSPDAFAPLLNELWERMDEPVEARRFFSAFKTRVRYFNGNLFKGARAFPLAREEIGELLAAASHKWTDVDPAIFGTLLEQALDPAERKKLGAHYTPRAYVQRLVEVTVMEPLRADWQVALTKAEAAKEDGKEGDAVAAVRAFHHTLCTTRVLDPACGTGNFLYVSLELMKKLEGEVLETLARLGESESMGFDRETVDPHQFLGLELNPRAAAIAELVVWLGYLQQHYRTRNGHPSEPILRAFQNINFGRREGYDAVLTWDKYPLTTVVEKDGKRVETYPNARRPEWPEAEFIVGNPPFIGKGEPMRSAFGNSYLETVWKVYESVNESADYVMYWWDHAANLLSLKNATLRRFGFVTTNSISQVFNRRVTEKYMRSVRAISLIFAIPDHPWPKQSRDSAAVRVAMTVAEYGIKEGNLIDFIEKHKSQGGGVENIISSGIVNSDLTIGIDVTKSVQLTANKGLSNNGMLLAGSGFILNGEQENLLHPIRLEAPIRPYVNGKDLIARRPRRFVIDFFGYSEKEVRSTWPELYQHILHSVKPVRDLNNRKSYRDNWFIFAEPRREFRPALKGVSRFMATTETTKHRHFQFVDGATVPDHMVVAIAISDVFYLAVLSSRFHTSWALRSGGWLGVGNDPRYSKSRCFDPFPFPVPPEALRQQLRDAGEELDALRKKVQAEHPDISLTNLYNVLEKLRAGASLTEKDEVIKERGLVLILKELHDTIDRLTAEAYGWPHDLTDEQILERLVALNAERAREEAAGHVRWLRPDYQIPRFGKKVGAKSGELALEQNVVAIDKGLPAFPGDRYEQPLAVEAALQAAGRPMDATELSRAFKGRSRTREARIGQVLVTLARYGRITASADGRYATRKAA